MILVNYYIVTIISILILFVGIFHLRENDVFSKRAKKRFTMLAYGIIFTICVDTAFKTIEGNEAVSTYVLYLLKAGEFILNPIICFMAFETFDSPKNLNRCWQNWIKKILITLLFVNAIAQIVSVVTNCMYMFYIDSSNVYHRTKFTYLYVICLIMSVALLVFSINIYGHYKQNLSMYTLIGFCAIFIAGFIVRTINTNTNFDWLCVSVAYLVLILYYFSVSLRLDSLTQLLNRRIYDNMVSRINFTTMVIIIDANNFKAINDTYGHECGDKTLRMLASCILKAYGEYGWCFRIGGDEFAVILRPDVFRQVIQTIPNYDVYAMSEHLMSNLDKIILKKCQDRDGTDCLRYGVSQGYGIYYTQVDYPSLENSMPFNKVLRLADKRMYRKKQLFKENFSSIEKMSFEEIQEFISSLHDRVHVAYKDLDPELVENSVNDSISE